MRLYVHVQPQFVMGGKKTSCNNAVYASPPFGGSASAKHQSGYRPLWCFAPAHFFVPVKLLTQFLLSGTKKRQKQREMLYAIMPKVFCCMN